MAASRLLFDKLNVYTDSGYSSLSFAVSGITVDGLEISKEALTVAIENGQTLNEAFTGSITLRTINDTIDLEPEQHLTRNYQLAPESEKPDLFNLKSPRGNVFVNGTPATIELEVDVKWNGTPGEVIFEIGPDKFEGELEEIETCLDHTLELLASSGRMVVISFHSLEDRIVKRFIRRHVKGDEHLPSGVPFTQSMLNQRLNSIGKAIKASAAEVDANPRSRSAVMRVAEKR